MGDAALGHRPGVEPQDGFDNSSDVIRQQHWARAVAEAMLAVVIMAKLGLEGCLNFRRGPQ
ncbi:hypothetical protein THIX_90093 [Thiomonas sp. X19]|nr:hypothetical protein THIX_90093 [Thiomonas sp. X19]